ncbi:MAG: diacylglycerol kinase family lipid kinase [Gemmatimonadota bacterium]|nr:diacylglycerol kinase family lipid kinase [Gemmatimonadota bacterium]
MHVLNAFRRGGIPTAVETSRPGHEELLAKQAIAKGARLIVVVGGDGTCSRVADAILQSQRECALAVVPCGTGNDFAKTLGVQGYTPQQIADLVLRGEPRRIDVGLADGHHFLNSCGFGFDASVLEATKNVRFLRGDAVYIYSALAQLFTYRGIDIRVDGAVKMKSGKMLMAVASNGRSLGGAFRIAPSASVVDGKLDFCLFSDSNVVGRVRLFAGALRGTHLALPAVTSIKASGLTLTFANSPAMEMDGELRQATSRTVKIECVPHALAIVAAPCALV